MGDWNTNDSWSGGGGVAAEASSWHAGAEPASNWDNGATDFATNGLTNTDAHGGFEQSADNAAGGGDDRTCRICNETGHLARECPQKPEGFGKCFNCGEEGQGHLPHIGYENND
ncbi:MAG: hypothetical protein Q9224_005237 [Gallowayella concinna]